MNDRYMIAARRPVMVNTDPQRRCYNGCNFSEELQWTEWGSWGRYTKEDAESSIATFKAANPTHEYKLVPYEQQA